MVFSLFSYFYYILSFLFALTSILILVSIRAHYPDFYKETGSLIMIAACFLSVPLLLEAIDQ